MAAAVFEALGPMLYGTGGDEIPTADYVAGADYLLLYFSASWCGPCVSFTPKLNEFFTAHGERLKFKPILIPNDRTKDKFDEYLGHMEWNVALPFDAKDKQAALAKRFKVQGIPCLVVVDKDFNTITVKGREGVTSDAAGARFPWKPRGLTDVLTAASFVDKAGTKFSWGADFAGKEAIGLYFSAHWCPPCRGFTPKLADWYNSHIAAGPLAGRADIIFVSSDRDEASFNGYLGEMPWKALSFSERAAKAELSDLLDVEGIPTLVFLKPNGEIITADGRAMITSRPEDFPWPPAPRDTLADAAGSYINDGAVAVLFLDKITDDAAEVELVEAFDSVAREYFAAAGGKPDARIRFAVALDGDEAADGVRNFLGPAHRGDKDGATNARLTIIDVPAGRKAMWNDGKVGVPSASQMREFVAAYVAGTAATTGIKA